MLIATAGGALGLALTAITLASVGLYRVLTYVKEVKGVRSHRRRVPRGAVANKEHRADGRSPKMIGNSLRTQRPQWIHATPPDRRNHCGDHRNHGDERAGAEKHHRIGGSHFIE